MEYEAVNVIYLDKRAREAGKWTAATWPTPKADLDSGGHTAMHPIDRPLSPTEEVDENVQALLSVFSQVSVYRSSAPCLAEIKHTYHTGMDRTCTILLIDMPVDAEEVSRRRPREPRSPSPTSKGPPELHLQSLDEPYGIEFLLHISTEIRFRSLPPRIIPIAILSERGEQAKTSAPSAPARSNSNLAHAPTSSLRYFDAGASDVLTSPTCGERVRSLPALVHHKKMETERRKSSVFFSPQIKKTSWVGTRDDKPYTQMKEAMVSELMDHICDPDREEMPIDPAMINVESSRHDDIAKAFGSWSFSAHDFTDDELLYGVFLVLQHTLELPDLEKWRMNKDQLLVFLIATRKVYNSSVLYHNFRHACDVLQATFVFLLHIGALPQFPKDVPSNSEAPSPLAQIIDPFHSLLLLISAIGHDVGHPGVNNGFLVMVNAPLAQLYNDRSVLESFHCAAYSQILRRYWPKAFADRTMRRLMINTILATDMGVHRDYMTQMEELQEKFAQNGYVLDGWEEKAIGDTKELLCCLLIKCADICNVARNFDVSSKWAKILIDEFYAQGQIERDLDIPSALFGGPPDPDSLLQKCQSQIGFMNVFAYPLFRGLSGVLPAMQFIVDKVDENKGYWQEKQEKIQQENERAKQVEAKAEELPAETTNAGKVDGEEESSTPSHLQKAASFNAVNSSPFSRRASGGTPSHFPGLSQQASARDSRRKSLGPTVVPDLSKNSRSPDGRGAAAKSATSRSSAATGPPPGRRAADRHPPPIAERRAEEDGEVK